MCFYEFSLSQFFGVENLRLSRQASPLACGKVHVNTRQQIQPFVSICFHMLTLAICLIVNMRQFSSKTLCQHTATKFILRLQSKNHISIYTLHMNRKPKAWRSPLRAHLDEIRQLRRAKSSWQNIANHLNHQFGIQITRSGVCRFFRRANHDRQPMGFAKPPVLKQIVSHSTQTPSFHPSLLISDLELPHGEHPVKIAHQKISKAFSTYNQQP
jgi:hypothetical protein